MSALGSQHVVTVSRRVGAEQHALRDRLIETAAALAEEGGYDAVSVSTVAEAAGVTRPTVYRYFPGKDHLLLEVGTTAAHGIAEQLSRESAPRGERWKRVATVLCRALELSLERPLLTAAYYCAVGSPNVVGELLAEEQHSFDRYIDGPLGEGVVDEEEKNVLGHVYMAATLNLARGLVTHESTHETLTSACRLVLGPRA